MMQKRIVTISGILEKGKGVRIISSGLGVSRSRVLVPLGAWSLERGEGPRGWEPVTVADYLPPATDYLPLTTYYLS